MAAKVKPECPCTKCGRDLWIPGNMTSVLGVCWFCRPKKVDPLADISGAMNLEDDEEPARPSCWFPAINGLGQGYLF